MSDWKFLNLHRVRKEYPCGVPERYWSTESAGWNGMFVFFTCGHRVRCVCSDGEGWKHVSVSIVDDRRPPKWDVMCAVKDAFFEPEDCVVQYHPPRSEYVNHHPGCLHLWMPLNSTMPRPPSYLVGPK
jgi:hypothetical protein